MAQPKKIQTDDIAAEKLVHSNLLGPWDVVWLANQSGVQEINRPLDEFPSADFTSRERAAPLQSPEARAARFRVFLSPRE